MKLQVLQDKLAFGLSITSRFASTRAQLPVLGNILFKTDKQKLILSATNLENSVSLSLGAKIDSQGEITLPAKNVYEIVNNLKTGQVELEEVKENVKLSASDFEATLQGVNSSDFPSVPVSLPQKTLQLELKDFKEALDLVLFSTSADETRPILTGVYFIVDKDLTLVATDGFRLSETKVNCKGSGKGNYILPRNILGELGRIDGMGDRISIAFDKSNNQVLFEVGEAVFSSRVLAGDFPDYKTRIPNKFDTTVDVSKSDLDKAIKLASVFARDAANVVKIECKGKNLKITSESSSVGSQESKIPASIEGNDITVAFNYKFLVDMLRSIKGESVQVNLNGSNDPVVFKDPEQNDYLHLIMPVKI